MSAMVTFNGVRVPEADVLKAAAEIQQRTLNSFDPLNPFPVEPGVYRVSNATDSDPFNGGATHPWRRSADYLDSTLRRKNADGSWSMATKWGEWRPGMNCDSDVREGRLVPLQPVEGVEYEFGHEGSTVLRWHNGTWEMSVRWYPPRAWVIASSGSDLWRTGQLRPITPTPWTPTAGEWVQHTTEPWDKVRRVTDTIGKSVRVNGAFALQAINNLRPATPDEIAAAKRIEPVMRMLLQRRDGDRGVFLVTRVSSDMFNGVRLDASGDTACGRNFWTLDHFDILSEYTVQGAQR